MSSGFYDCTGILATPDKNGDDPELYMVVSRGRGLGKTYSFTRHLLNTFRSTGGKFVLFCRYGKELGSIANGQFKGMLEIEMDGYWMEEKQRMHGVYSDVSLCHMEFNDEGESQVYREPCGYVIPLNAADSVKKISSAFTDSVHAYFDEFQPENHRTYVPDEVEKFKSIHTSIARGGGKSRRHYPVYMSSNAVTMGNPYFLAMGLHRQIQGDTKKYRGDGFVYQRTENSGKAAEADASPMSRAMPHLKSSQFSDEGWFMDDSTAVCRPDKSWGRPMYLSTIIDGETSYGLRWYPEVMLHHLGHRVDDSCRERVRLRVDGNVSLPVLKNSSAGQTIRSGIMDGSMRFQSQSAKSVALEFMV